MIRPLALVLCLSIPQAAPEKTVGYGNVLVRVPEGWAFEYKEEGLFLRPGDLKENEALVVIFSLGRKTDGTLTEGFETAWKQTAGKRPVRNRAPERELKTNGGVDGLLSVGLIDLGDNDRLIATVAAFKPGGRIEAVVAMTAQQAVFQRYSEDVRALLRGLRFRNIELPVSYELVLASDAPNPPSFRCLFPDGSLLTALPPEGMEGFDVAEARTRLDKSWGTWERKSGVQMLRIGDREEQLAWHAGGRLVLTDKAGKDTPSMSVPPATGLKFEGRYVVMGPTKEPQTMAFKDDGTFADADGVASRVKSGAYDIARNTITFTGADGRPQSVLFVALGIRGKITTPAFILIGGTWLKRS